MKTALTLLFIPVFLLTNFSSTAFSQQPVLAVVKVMISPGHKDWKYKVNEKARFTVNVLRNGNLIENVTIDYETGPERLPEIVKKGVILKTGEITFSGTMKEPGFYRVTVWASVDGKRYEGMATAAFEPEKILPVAKEADDLDSYWNNSISEARKIKLDPVMNLVPERCTSEANVYHINFQNDKIGSRIYGMLAIPKKPGKYPALLKVSGGGCDMARFLVKDKIFNSSGDNEGVMSGRLKTISYYDVVNFARRITIPGFTHGDTMMWYVLRYQCMQLIMSLMPRKNLIYTLKQVTGPSLKKLNR